MESQDLTEEMEAETRRIAAALGVKTFRTSSDALHLFYKGQAKGNTVAWMLERRTRRLKIVSINKGKARCGVFRDAATGWLCSPDPTLVLNTPMVRGLYCLGIEHKNAIEQLPKLSLQEKAELRQALPREFWPQKWLDEEGA